MRNCDNCDVCCIIPSIDHPSLQKPVNTVCPNLDQSKDCNKCKIYPDRPKQQCADFECMWKEGFGNDDDRPNQNHLLTCVRSFNNGTWIVAIETQPNAVTDNPSILVDLALKFEIPIIIQSYNGIESGDRTIIKNSLLKRAEPMTGDFIEWLDTNQEVGLYDLVNPTSDLDK